MFGPALFFSLVGFAALGSAPALAASPEPPELHAEPVFATTATLNGVLNPHSTPSEAGTYQFIYRKQTLAGEDKCKGTGETTAPAAPAAGNGTEHEELPPEVVKGLTASTEYAACLVAKNLEGEATSSPVSFTTSVAGAQETPEVVSPVEDTTAVVATPSTEALLHGVVNPVGTGEAGTYKFLYKKSITKTCTGESETTEGLILTPLREEPGQAISSLAPGTEYAVCLRVENNAKTEVKISPAVTFTTPVKPEAPKTEPVTGETTTTATLHGVLNPLGTATTKAGWYFAYNTEATCTGPSEQQTAHEAEVEGKAVSVTPTAVTELQPHQKYKVCLVATNNAGEAVPGTEVSFETLVSAPAISGETAAGVTFDAASLEAQIDPNNQKTAYTFEYSTKAGGSPLVLEGTIVKVNGGSELAGFGDQTASVATGVLTQDTTYYYRVTAKNEKSEETQGEVLHFNTPPEAPEKVEVPAGGITGQTATLTGVLNPKTPGEVGAYYEFVYRESASECQRTNIEAGRQETEKATLAERATGAKGEVVQAQLSGLEADKSYTVCLLVRDGAGVSATSGPPVTFTTAATPILSGVEAPLKDQAATTATLQAEVNPDGSEVTTCQFEYGTEAGVYPESVPCVPATIPSGTTPVPVSVTITEFHHEPLKPNTEYHWRLTATNAAGSTTSVDHVFNYTTGSENLPDNRAYEMVTPVKKDGGLIGAKFIGLAPTVSEDRAPAELAPGEPEEASRVIATTIQCFAPSKSCNAGGSGGDEGEPYEFTRSDQAQQCEPRPAPCWVTTALAPPATRFSENEPWGYDASADTALFTMPTGEKGEEEWYARQPGEPEPFVRVGPADPPESANVEPFKSSDTTATADLSHLIWENEPEPSRQAAFWPFDGTTGHEKSLYEYAGAGSKEPILVGVTGKEGSHELISTCSTRSGAGIFNDFVPWNGLSVDGHTVFFSVGGKEEFDTSCPVGGTGTNKEIDVPVKELYARVDGEEPDAHTVAISEPDAPQVLLEGSRGHESPRDANCASVPCKESIEKKENWRGATFFGASEDGSRVYFTSRQQLTDNATQSSSSENLQAEACAESGGDCNLYLYDSRLPEGKQLIDVSETSAQTPVSGGPRVQGVVATSADGSHVYFVAQGVLTGSQTNEYGAVAESEKDNLYMFDAETRSAAFIAALSGSDEHHNWSEETLGDIHHANVTPDGQFLVFQSHGDLTPGDTRGAGNQVFRYDADTGDLVRVSIGADGFDDDGNAGFGDATIVPAYESSETKVGPARGDPTMSNDGAYVFFQSPIALTPHALDDVSIGDEGNYAQNVYEWEAQGTEADGQVACAQMGGCVYLISDGRDTSTAITACEGRSEVEPAGSAVCLLGTDATGHNVFFSTAGRLVPADTDTQVDIYDARICEPENGNPCVAPEPAALPPCGGEACHGTPAATPSLLAPGTASFNGEGNITQPPPAVVKPKPLTRAQKLTAALKVCKKDKKKSKRATCEKQAKKKYAPPKKPKKAKGKK
jgi:hypothetical protein